jgi:hypothetical protein
MRNWLPRSHKTKDRRRSLPAKTSSARFRGYPHSTVFVFCAAAYSSCVTARAPSAPSEEVVVLQRLMQRGDTIMDDQHLNA